MCIISPCKKNQIDSQNKKNNVEKKLQVTIYLPRSPTSIRATSSKIKINFHPEPKFICFDWQGLVRLPGYSNSVTDYK